MTRAIDFTVGEGTTPGPSGSVRTTTGPITTTVVCPLTDGMYPCHVRVELAYSVRCGSMRISERRRLWREVPFVSH
jgi:hypothetical protein